MLSFANVVLLKTWRSSKESFPRGYAAVPVISLTSNRVAGGQQIKCEGVLYSYKNDYFHQMFIMLYKPINVFRVKRSGGIILS